MAKWKKNGAVGQFPLGVHELTEDQRYRYEIRCPHCGRLIGNVVYDAPRPQFDPTNQGFADMECHERAEEL